MARNTVETAGCPKADICPRRHKPVVPNNASLEASLDHAQRQIDDLSKREQPLIEAQRISGVGSYDFDVATNTNIRSAQLFRNYGREPQSFNASYEVFLGMLVPEAREHVMAVHQRALETISSYEMEERVVWPDGQVR